MLASLTTAAMADILGLFGPRPKWIEGFGGGTLVYRVSTDNRDNPAGRTLFITEQSVTQWDGSARYVEDATGSALRLVRDRFSYDSVFGKAVEAAA
jgi:hypothetical protein